MDDETKKKLAALFEADRRKVDQSASDKADREARDIANRDEFARIRDEVIRPAMEEMSAFVAEHGWEADIVTYDEQDDRDKLRPSRIAFFVFRDKKPGWYQDHDHPYFSVGRGGDSVYYGISTIMPGRGGSSGTGGGGAKLEEVTRELIQKQMTAWLAKVLGTGV